MKLNIILEIKACLILKALAKIIYIFIHLKLYLRDPQLQVSDNYSYVFLI